MGAPWGGPLGETRQVKGEGRCPGPRSERLLKVVSQVPRARKETEVPVATRT